MEANNKPPGAPLLQQWLVPFLQTEYYTACQTHKYIKKVTSNCNLYCTTCVTPICDHCKKSQQHEDHVILQIRRASHAYSVAKEDLAGLMDMTGIHLFKINKFNIHFLCARSSEGFKRKVPSKEDSLCDVCQWVLPGGANKSRFCSIQCKVLYESSYDVGRMHIVTMKPPTEGVLGVGGHGKKRAREEDPNHEANHPVTSTAVDPALKNNMASDEEEEEEEKKKKKKKMRHHKSFTKINGMALAGGLTVLQPEQLDVSSSARNSFRVRQRKDMPHRSAEFVIPDVRRLPVFPW